jgi:hypothetical protein
MASLDGADFQDGPMLRAPQASLGLGALVLTAACASFSPSPPIPLETTPADAEILAGDWYGNYVVGDEGRRGSILFKLVAGEDHAHGNVLMIPEGWTRSYEKYRGDAPVQGRRLEPAQVLTIRFVRAVDGAVTGLLDPYWDPERDCPATTTFRGAIGDGVIAGTFTTSFGSGVTAATGRWRVTRQPPRAPLP